MQITEIVAAMAPGSWRELPGTRMSSVFPPKEGHPGWGVEGPASVVADWCGGAFDSDRNVFIVTGGGHAAYGGNEIYEFWLSDLKWHRVTDPSPMTEVSPDVFETTDGSRVSSHTYDGLQYIPPLKSLFLWGGSQYRSGNNQDRHAYLFDLTTKAWHRGSAASAPWLQPATAWASKRGRMLVVRKTGLDAYDPVKDEWSKVDGNWYYQVGRTAAYSPDHDIFFMLGASSNKRPAAYIAFGESNELKTAPITGDPYPTYRPGLVYDTRRKVFVCWTGNADVWTIDPASWVCTRHTASLGPSAKGANGKAKNHGTYSRWQYIPDYDVCIGYNSTDDNVWLYRLPSEGAGSGEVPVDSGSGADGPGAGNGDEPGAGGADPTDPPVTGPGIISVVRVGAGQYYKLPSAAAGAVKDGDTVKIDAGEYTDGCAWPCGVNIESAGAEAPIIGNTVVQNKGAWVIQGAETRLTNIHLTGALGGTSNAAGIRHEGKSLILRNCEIDNCHNGILTSHDPDASLEVYDTHFHGMNTVGDLAHNIYAGKMSRLIVDGCVFEAGQSGHFVKSLTAHTTIVYSRIIQHADLDAALIDLWGCQQFEVVGNAMMRPGRYGALAFVQLTPRVTNGKTIACPEERIKEGLIAYNTAFFNNDMPDDPRWASLLHYNYPMRAVAVRNNFVVHCRDVVWNDHGYDLAKNGGAIENNFHTKALDSSLFADPANGDLRPARAVPAAVPIDFVPDRQIAFPIGTMPRADATEVGAFCGVATPVDPPVEPPVEPPPLNPQPVALPPGSYRLVQGKYEFEVK